MAKKTMKEVLLKVWFVFSNLYLFKITIDFFIGKADTVAIVCMIICYSVLTIHLISSFILFILVELTKYKELLDTGVITQEEFNTKKKQLLGIEKED